MLYMQGFVDHATASAMLEQLKTQDVHEMVTDLKQAMVNTQGLLAQFLSQLEAIAGLVAPTLKVVGSSFECEEKLGMCTNILFF